MQASYAGAGSRLLAFLVDVVVLTIVGFLVGMALGVVMGSVESGLGVSYTINILIQIAYYVFYQGSTGQTLGKKALGIRVVTREGTKPSMGTFFLREVIGKFISAIILFIGYLMILFDDKKQGLHDKIASTVVIKV